MSSKKRKASSLPIYQKTVNRFNPPRTPLGHITKRRLMNAWTTMPVAKNIKAKTNMFERGSPPTATREMAVMLRHMFQWNAPRNPGRQLYRGVTVNNIKNVRTKEKTPTSWTSNKKIAHSYSSRRGTSNGVILALVLNNKTPFIEIKPNKKVRWSGFKEHILPPGNLTIGPKNNNVYRVHFVPNATYMKKWFIYPPRQ